MEVAKCAVCGQWIDEGHENHWCPKCGLPLPRSVLGRLPKLPKLITPEAAAAASDLHTRWVAAGQPGAAASDSAAGSDSVVGEMPSSSPVVNRYRDTYRVGAALVGLGNAIKVVGAILAGIIFLVSLSSAKDLLGGGAVVLGIFIAAIVGILFWICGVIVAAQGQILLATVDTAVASSHFLTDTERAQAMGLPPNIADRSRAWS